MKMLGFIPKKLKIYNCKKIISNKLMSVFVPKMIQRIESSLINNKPSLVLKLRRFSDNERT